MKIRLAKGLQENSLQIKLIAQNSFDGNHPVFKGKNGEVWWESPKELWLGLGEEITENTIYKTLRKLIHQRKYEWPAEIQIELPQGSSADVEHIVLAVMLGGYDTQLYKTERKSLSPLFSEKGLLHLIAGNRQDTDYEMAIRNGKETAEVLLRIMDLLNAPSNKKDPGTLAKWALDSAELYQYQVKILDQTELSHYGFSALLAVNQGSNKDAALIVTQYAPENWTKTVALVGKGVTFDTGGISIKPSNNMHLMKSDMAGAAAVLGTVELAARLKLPIRVIGVVPATENSVDSNALKPGDVINSYAGKTIEVIDTDAEGRLILADGLSYAVREFKPDIIIDLATLTGSIIQTLGYHAAGLFTANDQLAEQLLKAGEIVNERLWRLPMWDDYKDEIDSEIADVKNFHGKPMAGAIVAAKFLEVFTEKHPAWAHLDIAGTAFNESDFAPGKMGTGFGVRLLRQFLENLV